MASCGGGGGDKSQPNSSSTAAQTASIKSPAGGGKPAVEDGTYQIKSACAGNLALDVFEAGTNQGSSLIVFSSHSGKNQQFSVQAQADGAAKITAAHSGLALDIRENSLADGAKAIQWPWHGKDNQLWSIESGGAASGQYRLIAKHSGKALDAHSESGSSGPAAGAAVQQWSSHGSCNQLWTFVPVAGGAASEPPAVSAAPSTVERVNTTYAPFTGTLLNPDRGFHDSSNLISSQIGGVTGQPDYAYHRERGHTLVRLIIRLDDFRGGPISEAALAQMNASFANMRQHGVKGILYFMYNFPATWDVSNPPPDAPLSVVLNHLDQLQPVFANNKDVIASMARGFIGAWGEGHASTNGLETPAAKQAIFDKILAVFPSDRMVQLRTVAEMKGVIPARVDAASAHTGSVAARTGLANQCFMVNDSDAGTYLPTDQIAAQKEYLAEASKYVQIGGETCEVPTTTRRDNCTNARIEMARYHYSYMNALFYQPTIDSWKADGCYNEIANKLGYRIELLRSAIAKSGKAGSPLETQIVLKNGGYAAPYNPRGLALVLRNTATQETIWLPVRKERDKKLDPRFWLPEDGEITVDVAPVIPTGTPAGTYQVLLSLHDLNPGLSSKSMFSIRTANEGIWEEGSGWNNLKAEIRVTQ